MKVKVVLEPSEDGGFTAFVPSLPGCISEGDTEEQAMANIQEAIALYLEPVDGDWVAGEHTVVKEVEV
jgi:predicted RNase H-like HicB family nuclease